MSTVTILQDQDDIRNFYSEIHILSDKKISEAGYAPQYESDLKMKIILESILVTCAILGIDKDPDWKMYHKWSQVSIVAGPEADKFLRGLPGSTSTSGAGPNTFDFFLVRVPCPPHTEQPQSFLDHLGDRLEEMISSDGSVLGSTCVTGEPVEIFDLYYQRDPRKFNFEYGTSALDFGRNT